jgi:hypothetical protein
MRSQDLNLADLNKSKPIDSHPDVFVLISQKGFCRLQYGIVTLLVTLGILHYVYAAFFGEDFIMKLTQVFDVNRENSIPTVFAIFNLLLSSTLLFGVYLHRRTTHDRLAPYWLALSVIFLVLSVDEGASLHERASGLKLFNTWVIYGALFSLAVFVAFIPFLLRIDRRTAALFILAGAIFVAGAVGLEYFGGWKSRYEIDFFHQAERILEEAFELYGVALFNCTLFRRIIPRNVVLVLSGATVES